ncbi:MAG: amino acid adenylation domain-containing protein [Longimicrobiales bacterium]|nr:amino acid adenylation domain-containing protein [Longimicrobiales bacterium]
MTEELTVRRFVELERTAPSTEAQKEIWTSAGLGPEASCAFNESFTLELRGPLHETVLRDALCELARRHDVLRSTFSPDGELLCVAREAHVPVEFVELDEGRDPDASTAVREIEEDEVSRPFDLSHGPLLRAVLARRTEDHHSLVVTVHHIVCDGWSIAILLREFGALYAAGVEGAGWTFPSDTPRFAAYAERSGTTKPDDLAYWCRQFDGSVPVLDLPTDRHRGEVRHFRSRRHDHLLDAGLVTRLKALAGAEQASFFVVLLGAFTAFLHRLTGDEDLVVGVPTAGQAEEGWSCLVGHCVNLIPLRFIVDPDASSSAHLKEVRRVVLDGFEHGRCTFGTVLRALQVPRDPSRVPLASVMFNLDRATEELDFGELEASFRSNPRVSENFELSVNAVEGEGGLVLECQYAADLFDEATVANRLEGYEAVLTAFVDDIGGSVSTLPVMGPEEEERVLHEWNATEVPFPREVGVHSLVSAQAARTPEAVAVVAGGRELTYEELEERTIRLAGHLVRDLGVGPGQRVGLALPRGADLPVALLAVLRTGAAYVPLDPSYPPERLRFMIEDGEIGLVLAREASASAIPDSRGCRVVTLDAIEEARVADTGDAPDAPELDPDPEAPAYVIFTSGSTGRPKGVVIPHRAAVNFLTSMAREPGMGPDDTLLAVTTFAFDIAFLELLLPLVVGARCLIADEGTAEDPAALMAALEMWGVTTLQATPTTWRLLVENGWAGGSGLRVLCGGEALPTELAVQLQERSEEVWNFYGPTETTVWSSIYRLPRALDGPPSLGRPIANTRMYILDPEQRPVPAGVDGELYIGGEGVALGYAARPDLTAERFLPDPFVRQSGGRMYRTGDRTRFTQDGLILFAGRLDSQVKIRGFRVELGEVEETLRAQAGVLDAAAVVQRSGDGDDRLVAYYTAETEQDLDDAHLRDELGLRLPPHMIPQRLSRLPELPSTLNRKLDRATLERMEVPESTPRHTGALPRTKVERTLAAIWADVLGSDGIGLDDDFFLLGGHSILATRVIPRVEDQLGVRLSLQRLFSSPVLRDLSRHVEALLAVWETPELGEELGVSREEFIV